ncbi:MAG: dockerin type I domain-containing protein [Clostridia bacterium]|nr:dockerin type I domain-containing protein [Clostridia bacterium]
MKGKKILSAMIAGTMVFGTMGFSAFAEEYVARIGDTEYTTLQGAVETANAMEGSDPVTINITSPGEYAPITITRGNVTVEGVIGDTAAESAVIKNTDTEVINAYNQDITLKNLWIDDSEGHSSYKSAVNVMGSRNSYYNLTVNNCHFVGNGQEGSIALYYHSPKLTVTDCTFENFERGYYGCGDNNAMEMLTVTGNIFNNVKVPVDGYWGRVYEGAEDYNIVITGNTFNPGTWETSYIQLWDYVQYGHYMEWKNCDEGSAIKAKIADNIYEGNTIFFPTHCNVNTVTKIDIDDTDKDSLTIIPRYFVDLPDEVTGADVTYADGRAIDLWNTTMYKASGNKKVLYTVPEGSFNVTVKKGELSSEESLTVSFPEFGSVLGTVPTVTLSSGAFKAVHIVESNKYFDLLADALSEAQNGETVKVLNDITLTNNILMTSDKAVTLDLNGRNLSCEGGSIMLYGSDMTVTGNGFIKADITKGSQSAIEVCDEASKLTIDSVNVNAGANNIIFVANGGEIVINGGDFTAENGGTIVLALGETSKVTLNDGKFVGKDGEEYTNHGTGVVWGANGANVNVYGGKFVIADDYSDPGINYTFFDYRGFVGKYVSNISTLVSCKANINVFGGTYNVNPAAVNAYLENINWTTGIVDYVASGYISTENADGTFTVAQTQATIIDTAKTTGAEVTLNNLEKNTAIDHEPDTTYKVVVSTAPKADAEAADTKIKEFGDTNTDKAIFDISVIKIDSTGVTEDISGTITEQIVTLTLSEEPTGDVHVYHVNGVNVEEITPVTVSGNKVIFTAPSFSTYAVTYTATSLSDTEIAKNVGVAFERIGETSEYDIVLKALDGLKINRFMSTDLTFEMNVTSGALGYTVTPAANINLIDKNDGRYEFNLNGIIASGITGADIVIGTVTFEGNGSVKFGVKTVATNIVNTAKAENNIVDNYTTAGDGTTTGLLKLNNDVTNGVINETFTAPKKDLTVSVAFNNPIENEADNDVDYQSMMITISGGDLDGKKEIKLGSDNADVTFDSATNTYTTTVSDLLTQNVSYMVTVSGEGYRTTRYNVTMTSNKTLNFWNNVMDSDVNVEEYNAASAKKVTFLAGDIVKDNNINIYDLSAVVSYFGKTELKTATDYDKFVKYDLNRDGKIDSKDVAYVLVSWNK